MARSHRAKRGITGALAPALLFFSTASALADWSMPEELRQQASALDERQLEFVTSGAVLEFIPGRQLEHELSTRDAESLRRLVNDLMALAAEMSYDAARDMGTAPLNLASKRFNQNTLPTPAALRELEREPGPFGVHRYLYPKSGVPTFAGAKVALWPEDLVAGDVDVAIIGVPSNLSSGRRDAAAAPDEMRALDTIAMPDMQSLVDPMDVLSVVDYGNFSIDYLSVERTVGHVGDMVAETAATGAIPMLVGGDTSLLYPGVAGIARTRGAGTFGLLHLSAHPDAARFDDHLISDRRAVFALLDQGLVKGSDMIKVGLRGPAVDVETLEWLREQEVRYHTMAEIRQRGFEDVLERVLREVDRGPDAFFVSVDVSVVDPVAMIAAGRIVPNGLRVEQVIEAVRHVCASKDIVGFEITDLAPMLDVSRASVLHANAILNACLVGIAVRRAGLDADYVHPLALDDGRR
jgi:agmatinase